MLRFLRSVVASLGLLAMQAFAANPCPSIAIGPVGQLPSGAQQIPYSATFTASGSVATPIGFQITSGLPSGSGLSINPSTGVLSGTPTQDGQFLVTVTGTDQNGCSGGRTYGVDIRPAVLDTVPANNAGGVAATATVTIDFTESVTASAGAFALECPSGTPIAFTVSPALPANASTFTLTPNANLPQNVACTATVTAAQIKATNPPKLKPAADYTFTFSTGSLPTITSANATTFTVGTPATFTVTTTGTPTASITRGGVALPSGVTFTDNGNGTGTLAATPAAVGTGGTYAITFTANNTSGSSPTQNFTLTIDEAPSITSANATSFAIGTAGTFSVTTSGFPKPAIARGGAALPSNVTYTDNGDGTGTLAGTPAAGTGGTYPITFTATNGVGSPANQNFTFSVVGATSSTALALTIGTNPSTYGQSLTFTATVTGSGGTPTGTVTFKDGATPLGAPVTVSGGIATFTTSTLGAGAPHSITAVYSGDGTFATSTSSALSQTVNQSLTTTTVNSSKASTVFGEPVTFTATVAPVAPGAGTPTGTVNFVDTTTSTTLGSGTLNGSGQATLTTSTLSTAVHTITATYSGDANFSTSNGSTGQTVAPGDTTTTVATSKSPTVYGEQVTFTATVAPVAPSAGTPTGTVTFLDGGSPLGTGTLSGGQATLTTSALSVATHTITASYGGDGNFNTSTSGNLTQTVNPAQTTTALVSSVNPSTINQNVTFTATVTAVAPGAGLLTGTVTFTDTTTSTSLGTFPLASGQASVTTNALALGTHAITATYSGDLNFGSSIGGPLSQVVNLNASTTTLTSNQNPSVFGQSVTLTATVSGLAGTPTGTVDFLDNGSPVATNVPLAGGIATFTTSSLTTSSHPFTAVYSGDPTYGGSTSNTLTQAVNQADTTTTVAADFNPSVVGQTVTFTITVAAVAPGAGTPTGTITDLSVDGTNILPATPALTLDGSGQAMFSTNALTLGSHTVTATYSSDVNFLASDNTGSPLTQVVNQASTTTTLGTSVSPSVFGQSVTFTATVAAPSGGTPTGGTVTFKDNVSTIIGTGTMTNGVATFTTSTLSVASHPITADYGGTASFAASSTAAATNQIVNKADTTATVVADVNPVVFGQTVTFTATVAANSPGSGTPSGTVTFLDNGSPIASNVPLSGGTAAFSTNTLSVGSHPITVSYGGDGNFNTSTSSSLSESVTKAASATALAVDFNPSVFGQSVTFTATVSATGGTPTGTVTFFDNGTPVASNVPLAGGLATYATSSLTVASHPFTAVYSGDSTYSGSTSSLLTEVVNEADTTTTVAADHNPSVVGQTVTFTITVAAKSPGSGTPSGTITDLSVDGTNILPPTPALTLDGSGQATFATSALTLGSHTITATYAGDGTDYLGSDNTASPLTQVVNQASTTTTLGTSVSPSVFGQSVTFTATVAAPSGGTPTGGTVTFKDNVSTIIGTGTMTNGVATFTTSTLSVASHPITADYGGTASYAASSTAAATNQVVNKADTTTALASSLNPSNTGDSVTFTATITATAPGAGTPASGTVTFTDSVSGTLGTGTVSGGQATLTTTALSAGARTITASYGGNGNFNASTSSGFSQTVNQPPKITSGSSAIFAPGKAGQTFQVTTTGFPTPGLSIPSAFASGVTFTDNGNGTATISGTPAAGTQSGSPYVRVITANNGVSPNDTQSFTLNIVCPTIVVSGASTLSAVYNNAMTASSYSQANGNGTITWTAPGLPSGVTIDSSGVISGTPSATGIFSVTVTATDAGGCQGTEAVSFSSAPQAVGDSYSGMIDNTQAMVTGYASPPSTPFIALTGTLIANDLPSGGVAATAGTFPTLGNGNGAGSVTIAADGTFIYTPHANSAAAANTTDSFTYTVVSNGVTSAPATVNLTLSNRVWYVNNSGVAAGNGQSESPFNTLVAAQGASLANDIIFVYAGNGTNSGQNSGITLKNGQQLLGEANGLSVGSLTIPAGSRPVIGNSGGDGVTITNITGVFVKGLAVAGSANGINISSSAANTLTATIDNVFVNNATTNNGIKIAGASSGTSTVTVQNSKVSAAAQNGIDAQQTVAGNLVLNINTNTVNASGNGININGNGSTSTTITNFANNAIDGNTGGSGILVTSATFDTTSGGTFQTVSGGTTVIGASGNGVGASGMVLTNVAGDLAFTDLDIFASAGAGLRASGTTPYTGSAGFRIGFPGVISPVATSTTVGGPAIDLSTVAMNNFIWQSISSTNSATTGAAFNSVTGTFSDNSGSSISGSTGTGFQVGSSNATFSYAGTINTTTGKGVDLTSNTGSTISFTGALTLSSGSSTAFNATGGGTVTATNTTSTLTSTTGTALNVASTTIGAGGLKFKSITAGTPASGPTNGIVLNTTGASGGLTVSGAGTAGSGGTIQKATGACISLNTTSSVSLSWMAVQNCTNDGIFGVKVAGFSLSNSSVTNNGTVNSGTTTDGGVNLRDTTGAVVLDTDNVSSNHVNNVLLNTCNGTAYCGTLSSAVISSLMVTNGTYNSAQLGSAILMQGYGTSKISTASITGATFNANVASGPIDAVTNDNSTIGDSSGSVPTGTLTISGNTFTNNQGVGPSFANGGGSGVSHMYVRFINNNLQGTHSQAVNVVAGATSAAGSTQKVLIDSNIIGTAGVAGSGSAIGEGIVVTQQGLTTQTVTITNNTIRQVPLGRGIDVEALGPVSTGQNPTGYPTSVVITGNDVNPQDTTGFPLYAIYVSADNQGSPTLVNAAIHGNTVPTTAACDSSCTASTGMIWMEQVVGSGPPNSTGTLFNFSGSGANVSSEIVNTNTGMSGKTGSPNIGMTLTGTAPPVVN